MSVVESAQGRYESVIVTFEYIYIYRINVHTIFVQFISNWYRIDGYE